MSSGLAGQMVPGTGQVMDALSKAGEPPNVLVAAHPRSKAAPKKAKKQQPLGVPPGPAEMAQMPQPQAPAAGGGGGPGNEEQPTQLPAEQSPPPPPPDATVAPPQVGPPGVSEPLPKPKKQVADPQEVLRDRVTKRMGSQINGAIPLEPDIDQKGRFKADSKGNPLYKKIDYDLTNTPMLQQEGKTLGKAKAPAGTVDKLEKGDLAYLNPTDRLRVSHLNEISAVDSYAKKLAQFYKSTKDVPEVMKAKDWYNETEAALRKHFGDDADLVANLLAATSAGTNVKVNYKLGMQAYNQYKKGDFDRHIDLYRKAYDLKQKNELTKHVLEAGIHHELPPTEAKAMALYLAHHDIVPRQTHGALFGMNSLPVLKVLAHTWHKEVEGPKTPNYAGNLSGKTLQATIDLWAARTMRRLGHEGHTNEPWLIQPSAETGVNNVDFGLSQLAFRKAAKKLGLEPRQLQSILWFAEQKHYQKQGWEREIDPSERDYRPMLKASYEAVPASNA
jgi:hypothetical protein